MATEAKVSELPHCDICAQNGMETPAEYDFKTKMGPWANACEPHWIRYRAFAELGTGKGQKLVTK